MQLTSWGGSERRWGRIKCNYNLLYEFFSMKRKNIYAHITEKVTLKFALRTN